MMDPQQILRDGGSLVAFLVVALTFVRQVVGQISRMVDQVVERLDTLINQQAAMQTGIVGQISEAIGRHQQHCDSRHQETQSALRVHADAASQLLAKFEARADVPKRTRTPATKQEGGG